MKVSPWVFPTRTGLPRVWLVCTATLVFGALILTSRTAGVDFLALLHSVSNLVFFIRNFITLPNWIYTLGLVGKMIETIEIALVASTFAFIFSLPIGVLAARNASPHPLTYHITRDILSFMRALPDLVWALLFVSALGLGPLPGVLGLTFVTIGFMAKFFAESLEVVDRKAIEALEAQGAGWLQVRVFAMLPQVVPDFIATFMYALEHNLRAAAILGVVGAGGIGYEMITAIRLFKYDRLVAIIGMIYLTVTLLDHVSHLLRKKVI